MMAFNAPRNEVREQALSTYELNLRAVDVSLTFSQDNGGWKGRKYYFEDSFSDNVADNVAHVDI